MRGTLGADLRRAALRALAVAALVCGLALLSPASTPPGVVALAVAVVEVAFVQSLADLRTARRARAGRDPAVAAWFAGALVAPVAALQAAYAAKVLAGVDPAAALHRLLGRLDLDDALPALLAGAYAAVPLALAGQLRREGREGLTSVAKGAAVASLLGLCSAPILLAVFFVSSALLGVVLALPDAVADWLGTGAAEDEVAHLRRRLADGELPRARAWALAWADHPAARAAVTLPEPPPLDLAAWIQGFDACRDVFPAIARSVGEVVAPHARAVEALQVGWSAAEQAVYVEQALEVLRDGASRQPAAPAAARALLELRPSLAGAARPVWGRPLMALREALAVVAHQDDPWGSFVVWRRARAGALLAAEVTGDVAGVRESIRAAVTSWLLDPTDPRSSSAIPTPVPSPDGGDDSHPAEPAERDAVL